MPLPPSFQQPPQQEQRAYRGEQEGDPSKGDRTALQRLWERQASPQQQGTEKEPQEGDGTTIDQDARNHAAQRTTTHVGSGEYG